MIIAAADGSALGNPGPAGWAWYVDDDCWASGGWPRGTNNMGELMAVLDLLQQTAHVDDELHVFCDSKYVIDSITKWMAGWKRKGWKKGDGKPVMNVELMKALDAAMQGRRRDGSSGSRATPATGSTRRPTSAPTPPRSAYQRGGVADPGRASRAAAPPTRPRRSARSRRSPTCSATSLADPGALRRGAGRSRSSGGADRRGALGPRRDGGPAAPRLAGGRPVRDASGPARSCWPRSARSRPRWASTWSRPSGSTPTPSCWCGAASPTSGSVLRSSIWVRTPRAGSSASTRAPGRRDPPRRYDIGKPYLLSSAG